MQGVTATVLASLWGQAPSLHVWAVARLHSRGPAGAASLVHEPRAAISALQGLPAAGAGRLLASGHTSAAVVDEAGDVWVAGEVASVPSLYCANEVRP